MLKPSPEQIEAIVDSGVDFAYEVNKLHTHLSEIPTPDNRDYYDHFPLDLRYSIEGHHEVQRRQLAHDIDRTSTFVGILIGRETLGGDVLQLEHNKE